MNADSPLVVSSLPMIRRWLYGSAVLVPFWLGAVGYALLHRPGGTQWEQSLYGFARAMSACVPLLLLINALLLTAAAEWTLTAEEIIRRPMLGRVRRVRWSEIRRIRWNEALPVLQGAGETIAINAGSLGAKERAAVMERLTRELSSCFDLSKRVRPRPTRREVLRSWAWIIALALPTCTAMAWMTFRHPLSRATPLTMLGSLAVPILLVIPVSLKEERRPSRPGGWRERNGGSSLIRYVPF